MLNMGKEMLKIREEERTERVLSMLPTRLSDEIGRILRARRGGIGALSELRIRVEGRCSLSSGGEVIPLVGRVTREDMDNVVERVLGGALYAHRDSIASGYVSLGDGIRVGVCGYARYEYKELVGVSEMRSLVFRLPSGECEFSDELAAVWRAGVSSGMLIYSPPGVGKTTALRSLAHYLGGEEKKRVVIVDERCEFSEEDYVSCEVDILKGYKRREGIEIATRTMSADVIMIDEIGGDEAESLSDVIRCGIPIIATAHGKSCEELFSRRALSGLLMRGAFDVFLGISREESGYRLTVERK